MSLLKKLNRTEFQKALTKKLILPLMTLYLKIRTHMLKRQKLIRPVRMLILQAQPRATTCQARPGILSIRQPPQKVAMMMLLSLVMVSLPLATQLFCQSTLPRRNLQLWAKGRGRQICPALLTLSGGTSFRILKPPLHKPGL